MEREKSLPLKDRYIFGFQQIAVSTAWVIVTLHPGLATWIHRALYIEVDTTFKRVFGNFNEWKVVIWLAALNRS